MRDDFSHTTPTAVDLGLLGSQLWGQIQDLFVDWANAGRMDDADAAASIEQEFRRVALAFAAMPADGEAVSTGRKAIIRSIVERHGTFDQASVLGTLHAVIRREEEEAARRSP